MAKDSTGRAYSLAVVKALAQEFPDLTDATTAEIVSEAVRRYHLDPNTGLEVIVDSPYSANWRLRPDREHPGRVRLACYRFNRSQQDDERENRVNEALRAIG